MIESIKNKNWYLIFTTLNLILSIVAFNMDGNYTIWKRLESAFAINLGYHMMYVFISYAMRFQLFMVGERNPIYRMALKAMKIYGYLFSLAGIGMFGYVMFSLFYPSEFKKYAFLAIGIPFGLILGGMNLVNYTKLKTKSIR